MAEAEFPDNSLAGAAELGAPVPVSGSFAAAHIALLPSVIGDSPGACVDPDLSFAARSESQLSMSKLRILTRHPHGPESYS